MKLLAPVCALGLAALAGCAARAPLPDAAATPEPSGAAAAEAPVVREVVLEGISAFTPDQVHRAIRLRPGGRLRRDPARLADDLATRYKIQGYEGVRVRAEFDAPLGRLVLRVDEGALREVAIDGVEGDAAARALEVLDFPLGKPVRYKELRSAVQRLEEASGGALDAEEPPWVVEPLADGVRLRVRLKAYRHRITPRLSGPDLSPLHNRVEGTAPGAGADLTLFDAGSFHHTVAWARAGYAFSAEEVRYAVGVHRPLGPAGLAVGYELHDMTDTDDAFRRRLVEEPRGRPMGFSITEDYFRRRGHEAYAFVRPSPRLHIGLSWRAEQHESLRIVDKDSVFFSTRRPRPNPPVDEGDARSLLVTARWVAHGGLYAGEREERESMLVREPYGGRFDSLQRVRLETTWEVSAPGLGGDFDFSRLIVHARGTRPVSTRHAINGRLLVGATTGAPPPQRLFALGGHGTLRGYALKQFTGRGAVLATAEWTYQPASRWPGLLAFYDGGAAWTSGRKGTGWRDDVGVGMEWPGGGRASLRADLGYALRPEPGQRRARLHALLRLPF